MSNCNPPGPSRAGLLVWLAITALLTVLLGGPLFALVRHIGHAVGPRWLIAGGVTAAVVTAGRSVRRRRASERI